MCQYGTRKENIMRDWLINLRVKQNVTQSELSQKIKISRAYYSRIETGERRPSPEVAQNIAKILNFDWTLFFKKKGA